MEFSNKTKVSGGLPLVASAGDEFTWKVGVTFNYETTSSNSTTSTISVPVKVAPMTKVDGTFSWGAGVISNLPYSATYHLTFTDNSTLEVNFNGDYDGVSTSDFTRKIFETKLTADDCKNSHMIIQ